MAALLAALSRVPRVVPTWSRPAHGAAVQADFCGGDDSYNLTRSIKESKTGVGMQIIRRVVVFDAKNIDAESRFWAGLLGGTVHRDDDWHSIVVDGEWVIGVQHAPNHVAPEWPSGPQQQQVHLDLHVDDVEEAGQRAIALGAHQLQSARKPADNPDGDEVFAVFASPAGHPFCFGSH